jgi:hypothetical protein
MRLYSSSYITMMYADATQTGYTLPGTGMVLKGTGVASDEKNS